MQSPKRINIPLPAGDSIFATRTTASQLVSSASNVITPSARRRIAAQEESAAKRDRTKASSGLGERMRHQQRDRESRQAMGHMYDAEDAEEANETMLESNSQVLRNGEENPISEDDEMGKPTERPRRHTRQRTRELSVLSDASMLDGDKQEFSPRRSTRNQGKGKGREESAEALSQSQISKRKASKVVKSPDPSNNRSPGTLNNKQAANREKMKEDEEEQVRRQGTVTKSGRRARSPRPDSPPPSLKAVTAKGRRTGSTILLEKVPPWNIAQVISSESTTAQEEDTAAAVASIQPGRMHRSAQPASTSAIDKRPVNGYSFKDEMDEMEEGEDNLGDPAFSSAHETAKLKLPNSVFANRFSFGKAPTSPVLVPQRTKSPESRTPGGKIGENIALTSLSALQPKAMERSSSFKTDGINPQPAQSVPMSSLADSSSSAGNLANDAPAAVSLRKAYSSDAGASATVDSTAITKRATNEPPLFSFKAPISIETPSAGSASLRPLSSVQPQERPAAMTTSTNHSSSALSDELKSTSLKRSEQIPSASFDFGRPAGEVSQKELPYQVRFAQSIYI